MSIEPQPYLPPGQFTFEVIRRLGSGGFGVVDEIVITASNSSLASGTHLARKRLNSNFATHPEARERFEREIEQVRSMAHIEGVVNYQGENLLGGERFYAMDIFPRSLRAYIAQRGARPWREVAGFISSVASTMAEAHAMGFIHRDIKPENVLLTMSNGHVIADWGLGYFLHQHSKVLVPLTRGGMGSEYYCSMEQWATGKCDERGDIYSLGMLAAELATGSQRPLSYQGAGLTTDLVEAAHAADFNAVLREMTAVLPGHRPNSMNEVATRLATLSAWGS